MSINKILRHTLLSAAVITTGCDDLGFGNNVTDGSLDDLDPTLANVQEEIFTPFCGGCHSASGSAGNDFDIRLDTAQNAYDTLVGDDGEGIESQQYGGLRLVNPGNPDASYIVWKVESDSSRRRGDRMPQNGNRLSSGRINLLRDWIARGALEFGGGTSSAAIVSNAGAEITATNTVTFSLHFSQRMDELSLDRDNLLVYVKVNGEYQQLDYENYHLAIIDSNDIEIDVDTSEVIDPETYEPATVEAIKLIVNDENLAAVMSENGYLLDGNKDREPGGAYEYIYTMEKQASN